MRVLLVEDSATVAAYVASILGSEAEIQLLPVAVNAEDGVRVAIAQRPDVILMDMKLPDHDGLWAIEQIMRDAPCPIVVLSGHLSSRERDITFESLRAGAVDVLAKPAGLNASLRESFRQNLVNTVRLMSTAVVVRRTRRTSAQMSASGPSPSGPRLASQAQLERLRYVLMGSSTGGPEVLYRILGGLKAPLAYPVVLTQHTLEGFDDSLAQWLSCTGHQVSVAQDGDMPEAGKVYLTPAESQLKVGLSGLKVIPTRRGEPIASVDSLFESAAKTWGEQCLAIVLTGMGKDGAAGMRALFDRGALTVAQAPETCVVASMPESARSRGGVRQVLTPEDIVSLLRQLSETRDPRSAGGEFRRGR